MNGQSEQVRYVLITPARNEAEFIEKTIESVVRQSVLPVKWVIANDGSTDSTKEIVAKYAAKHDWIVLVNLPIRRERHFAAKVHAFNAALEQIKHLEYQVIGNLDADVSLDPDHFEFLLARFNEDNRLGVAGTVFREKDGYNSETDSLEGQTHVSGQCQLFRRQCFEEIGGYFPSKAGGIDWIAVTTARMIGWKTRSFREKSFLHHRKLGTAEEGVIGSSFAYGKKDYILGGHPLWEIFRCLYRMTRHPYVLGGVALLAGYATAFLSRAERSVSCELMRFHRHEQMMKLKTILLFLCSLKRFDSFALLPVERTSEPVVPAK